MGVCDTLARRRRRRERRLSKRRRRQQESVTIIIIVMRLKRSLSSSTGFLASQTSWPSTNGLSNVLGFFIYGKKKNRISIAEKCTTSDNVNALSRNQKCKVIATIGGEKSKSVEDLCSFLESGVTVARYDFSHSTSSHEEFQDVMKNLTKAQKITVSFETTTTTIKQRAFCRCNRTPPRMIVLYSLALTFFVLSLFASQTTETVMRDVPRV